MWTVVLALLPAIGWSVYVFGPRVLWLVALGVVSAVATEALCQAWRRKPITVHDGSAVLTGIFVVLVFPVHVPWYVVVTGSVFGIGVAKHAFGGLGCNIWNPALAGRAFVLAAWTGLVTVGAGWPVPFHHHQRPRVAPIPTPGQPREIDATTGATPLTDLKEGIRSFNSGDRGSRKVPTNRHEAEETLSRLQHEYAAVKPLWFLFGGRIGGCVGEVSKAMLLIGGVALIALGYVRWQLPIVYIATVALLTWFLPVRIQGEQASYLVWCAGMPLFHIFAGGLFLGAFFMATDMVTCPVTAKGQVIFAVGCGVLTSVIRVYGGYPEGVCYAILLMNTATPLIDRYTKRKVFGQRPKSND
jgi:electron transport complex protein RnfD